MDSQSVETATMVSKEVGYDSGKKIKVLCEGCTWRGLPGDILRLVNCLWLFLEVEQRWYSNRLVY